MKGVLFNVVEEAITSAWGRQTWDDLLNACALEGSYTPVGSYPEADLVTLVNALAGRMNSTTDDVMRTLGRLSFEPLLSRAPALVCEPTSLREFLPMLNGLIHADVLNLYPGATLPRFVLRDNGDDVEMDYLSVRNLCKLAEGLIIGVADFYGETVSVDQPSCKRRGDSRCTIRIKSRRRITRRHELVRQGNVGRRSVDDRLTPETEMHPAADQSVADVASDRFELGQQRERKLALRTAELDAARRMAAEAVIERDRFCSELSHGLRTSLTALVVLAESLSDDAPPSAQQIAELKNRLSEIGNAIDSAARTSTASDTHAPQPLPARLQTGRQKTLAEVASDLEPGWHRAAARSGKLLMLDIETPASQLAESVDEVNQSVLRLINERATTPDPVLELHLSEEAGLLEVR